MNFSSSFLKISTFVLASVTVTSSFAGRSQQELLEANIDTVVIGGCGPAASYGLKHPPTTLTWNLDPEAEADFTLDAFQYDETVHPWLEQHFSGKLKSVAIEHIGGNIVDTSSDMARPTWFITDPQAEDARISQSLAADSLKDFDEEMNRMKTVLQSLSFDLLTSSEEQERRPHFMKVFHTYVGLLKPGGSFEWQSGILEKEDRDSPIPHEQEILQNNQVFLENTLNLNNVKGQVYPLSESYKVYTKPQDYADFGRDFDHLAKYHMSVKGFK